MNLGIITPHYNDLEGLKNIYRCLHNQTDANWEWVVVDDSSLESVRLDVEYYFKKLADNRVQVIFNTSKQNASVCRNIGADNSISDCLVFLDSDDLIAPDFVFNRKITYKDFAVFGNYKIVNKNDEASSEKLKSRGSFLNSYLSAQFLWQTTCILWNKSFFNAIGKFHPDLPRLQDVELSIRALQNSSNFSVIDNPIDFYYQVKPIRERKNFVKPVCEAVYLFMSELLNTASLDKPQKMLLSGYYYLCTKYLERAENANDILEVRRILNLFYNRNYITRKDYWLGKIILHLYRNKMISGKNFLRFNRYLFKTKKSTRYAIQ